jgi:hypothetical protein
MIFPTLRRGMPACIAGILAFLCLSPVLVAGELLPLVPPAKARFSEEQACVEPLDDIRKNHMEYLLHQRDDTVHDGIRTKQHSLTECIDCHVGPDQNNEYPRISSDDHFCNSCHTYAAVSIDCFQCHSDRPAENLQFETLSRGMMPDLDNATK